MTAVLDVHNYARYQTADSATHDNQQNSQQGKEKSGFEDVVHL